ncbi:MAG: outer membrane protein assembly factor BamD [Bdellovibrionaceae bacterium]|nr:outer membrane protein assembly factor BamD [Pseudobdellovibrionaceae bacterium]
MLRVIGRLCCALALVSVISCASEEKSSDTPEGAYAIAEEFAKDDRYEEAIRRFNDVKNKYPYSKFATMAELAVADTYFKQESYPEAQVSYQTFKELHPKHAQIDYVTYRLGLSFFEQLPETEDRDLSLAQSSIIYFDEVMSLYPNSPHAKEAQEKKTEVLKKLGAKEMYIADFYFKRKVYASALTRYEGLLRTYPNLGFDALALSRAAQSAAHAGELDRAKQLVARLKTQFAGSSELADAEKVLQSATK